jgi:hypothetical protein
VELAYRSDARKFSVVELDIKRLLYCDDVLDDI